MIRSLLWKANEPIQEMRGIADFDALFAEPEAVLWIDMLDPDDSESFILTHDFHFHPLAIEDVIGCFSDNDTFVEHV